MDKFVNNNSLLKLVFNGSSYRYLEKKSIFVTGSTGFLGKWIIQVLIYLNYYYNLNLKVYLLVRDKKKSLTFINQIINSKDIFIEYIEGDIRNFKFPTYHIDHVIHLASNSSEDSIKNYKKTLDIIINGTNRIYNLSDNLKVSSLTFLSSGAVYGKHCPDNSGWQEDDLIYHNKETLDNPYAIAKKKAENYLLKNFKSSNNIRTLNIFRAFSFGGSGFNNKDNYAFNSFIKNRIDNKTVKVNSNGKSKRNYMHPLDLTNWILNGFKFQDINIINTGSTENYSIKKLAEQIAFLKYKNLKKVGLDLGSIGQKENYIPNTNKAKKMGLKTYIPLKKQIEDSLNYYYNNLL